MPCTFNIPITSTPSGSRGGLRHCPDREFDSEPIKQEGEKYSHGNEGYNLTKKKREAGMGLKGFRG